MLRISPASDRLSLRFLRRGVPPPQLQRSSSRIRPLSTVAPAPGLDVSIYDGSPKVCAVSVLAHGFTIGLTSARICSWYVLSDLQTSGIGGYPVGTAFVGRSLRGRLYARM